MYSKLYKTQLKLSAETFGDGYRRRVELLTSFLDMIMKDKTLNNYYTVFSAFL